jgi:hypothetical protein
VVLISLMSMLGFWIDADAAPARVSLAVIGLLMVLQNYFSLTNALPTGTAVTWLQAFQLTSFVVNLLAFIEQVSVYGSHSACTLHCSRALFPLTALHCVCCRSPSPSADKPRSGTTSRRSA